MKDDVVYLRHIVDSIARIDEYLRGVPRETFLRTDLLKAGTVRELEIIGESVRSLSVAFRERNTAVPWSRIIGLRNRLIHGYITVNYYVVWEIVQNDIPALRHSIEEILRDFDNS